jgi:hypothetical protein
MSQIRVYGKINPRGKHKDYFTPVPPGRAINCTSKSGEEWTRELSPMVCGPVVMPSGDVAINVEAAWQYSKVYLRHRLQGDDAPVVPRQLTQDESGNPVVTEAWWKWARGGWKKPEYAHDHPDFELHKMRLRYPMGKGAVPEFSYYDGKCYGYIEARRYIYAPLYAEAVQQTAAFARLKEMVAAGDEIRLFDFDGCDHVALGKTIEEMMNDPKRPWGHGFVLAHLLEGGKIEDLRITTEERRRELNALAVSSVPEDRAEFLRRMTEGIAEDTTEVTGDE